MSDHIRYTIVSVPFKAKGDQQPASQFQLLQQSLGPQLGPALRHFMIPSLKIGTLDSLMEASDELAKLDPQIEGACFKLAAVLEEASQGKPRSQATSLKLGRDAKPVTAEIFVKEFSWLVQQYDTKDSIANLLKSLNQAVIGAEDRSRKQISEYTELKNALLSAQRKTMGSWNLKPINDAVTNWCKRTGKRGPLDTDFITTIFVSVAAQSKAAFLSEYRHFHDYVVPNSAQEVASDADTTLFAILCFKKAADDVRIQCRKNKYNVRELSVAEDGESTLDAKTLEEEVAKKRNDLVTQLTNQFTQCFVAWIHVKAIRVFVESMLKYGLPPKFVPVLIAADEKKEAEIRKHLEAEYPEYANPFANSDAQGHAIYDVSALEQEYPYVSLRVANILQSK